MTRLCRHICWLLLVALLFAVPLAAQQLDTGSAFTHPIQLDSFVVRSGFDINKFIQRVRTDTTFYKAIRSMHLVPYKSVNKVKIYNSDGQAIAGQYSQTTQIREGNCRRIKVDTVHTNGKYYKRNGEPDYYTVSLFENLFYTKDTVCNEDDIVAGKLVLADGSKMEKNKYRLKQLLFNPGARISGIPFMADRQSIFDPDEAKNYNFRVTLEEYEGQPAYVFSITPAPGHEKDVIYDRLITWFRKSDYSILARNYSLSYHTLVYDFDVDMQLRMTERSGKLYPTYMYYRGNWHVFSQKRERVNFEVSVSY